MSIFNYTQLVDAKLWLYSTGNMLGIWFSYDVLANIHMLHSNEDD